MKKVIKNCLITNSDAEVLREYCIDKSSPLYREYKAFNTSWNLSATNVYNMYFGNVIMIPGDSRSGYEVVVLLNQNQAIKYGHLKSVDATLGQTLDIGDQIGTANRFVKVEYLSTYVKNPFSFRVGSIQMYKDDPAKLFEESRSTIEGQKLNYYNQSGLRGVVSEYDGGIDAMSVFELSNNRGN